MAIPLPKDLYHLLVCPYDHGKLLQVQESLLCTSCDRSFPVHEGVPVLVNTERSLFSFEDLMSGRAASASPDRMMVASWLGGIASSFIPKIGNNLVAQRNFQQFRDLLLSRTATPLVLIVGSGEVGQGLRKLLRDAGFTFVEADVYLSSRVNLVADAHDLPFEDGCFDGVICQAVLEHVLDPQQCVREIHRVLGEGGLVYSETAFMQQVHGRAYDFTRFSFAGHRYLFRDFEQESAGVACGPGMALAWSIMYFFLSFSTSPAWHLIVRGCASLLLFWLKYIDYLLARRPAAADGASGFYFLGRKSITAIRGRDLVRLHWSSRSRDRHGL